MEDYNFWKTFFSTAINSKYFLLVVSYIAGIFSSVIIFRLNDRYKRKGDLLESVALGIIFLEKFKNFTGSKIELGQIQKIRNVLKGRTRNDYDVMVDLVHKYNAMPRHDSVKSAEALREFHTQEIVPAVIRIIERLKSI